MPLCRWGSNITWRRFGLGRGGENDARGWTDAAFSADIWLRLTPGELSQLSDEVTDLLRRWHDRAVPDDDAERDQVFVFAHGVPGAP
ncbi:MAG: hypothetical protein M3071_14675 [Actinomycetota bacterium]|nr:hypothetical protein [Actinomycetota bacterium]